MTRPPFWIDLEYDHGRASDGVSRYGAYVRKYMGEFAECWDGTYNDRDSEAVEFAATAWRIATGPVMSPGYVRYHRRVRAANLARSKWDGTLVATVSLVSPWPAALSADRSWQGKSYWRDWPTDPIGDEHHFVEPMEQDVTRAPHLMATVTLAVPMPLAECKLPRAPKSAGEQVVGLAEWAVSEVAMRLSAVVAPVIDRLEAGQ